MLFASSSVLPVTCSALGDGTTCGRRRDRVSNLWVSTRSVSVRTAANCSIWSKRLFRPEVSTSYRTKATQVGPSDALQSVLQRHQTDLEPFRQRDQAVVVEVEHTIAVRHQSFQPLTGPLPKDALPLKMRKRRIDTLDCDQSNFLSGGALDPIGAVRQQQRLAFEIAGIIKTDSSAALGYYGIVHIPLQFLAGCSVSTFPKVALFELQRETSTWRELADGDAPDLDVTVSRTIDPPAPIACVVRIAVSYAVGAGEPSEVVGGPYRDYSISIGKPGIDKVTHYSQVDAICRAFRQVLDEIHGELPKNLVVHVFYAGPVSVGFSLGRRISRTIHNPVLVYNYTKSSAPAYAWGVEVTKEGKPEDMVVITT